MKSFFFATLLILGLSLPSHASTIAWDKITWGMQPQDVSRIIGTMVRTVDNPGRFTHQIDGQYKGYRLAFTFFGKRGLERLALIDTDAAGLPERFGMIREALTLKYGKPFNEEASGTVRLWEWLDDNRLIQLHYRASGTPILNIVYIWRKSAMTEEY